MQEITTHPGSISRREFMATTTAAGLTLSLCTKTLALGENVNSIKISSEPNLLFIWTDQQQAATLAAYGNTAIKAPNLNRLAQQSVVFERAYVTSPVCTPSRSSVMSGLWPHQNGAVANNDPLHGDVACLPELLADGDYRTGYMGKWHLGDEVFAQHGYEEWVSIEDHYYEYFSEGRDRSARSSYNAYLKSLGLSSDRPDDVFGRRFATDLPLEQCKPVKKRVILYSVMSTPPSY